MSNAPHDELPKLLARLLDQELTTIEKRRLAALLAESAAARQQYLDMMELSALLSGELAQPLQPSSPHPQTQPSRRALFPWLLTLAAAIMLGASLGAWQFWPRPSIVAQVTLQGGDRRFEQPGSLAPGQTLQLGETVAVSGGFLQIEFVSGARVMLQGEGELVVDRPNGCRLLSGDLTAEVPPSAIGFSVTTAAGTVRDLGTRFRLRQLAAAGPPEESPQSRWRLSVLAGKVELTASDAPGGPRQLTQDQTADFGGSLVRIRDVGATSDGDAFSRTLLEKIERCEGPLTVLTTPPETMHAPFFAAAKSAVLLIERQEITLVEPLDVDLTPDGRSPLAAGMTLNSFLVHLDVANDLLHADQEDRQLVGAITFVQPIAGVITDSDKLLASDATCGLAETSYPSQGVALTQRGSREAEDLVELVDRHTVRFRLSAPAKAEGRCIDEIRIFTIAQP